MQEAHWNMHVLLSWPGRFEEQLRHWLEGDSLDTPSLPLFIPSTLLTLPELMSHSRKPPSAAMALTASPTQVQLTRQAALHSTQPFGLRIVWLFVACELCDWAWVFVVVLVGTWYWWCREVRWSQAQEAVHCPAYSGFGPNDCSQSRGRTCFWTYPQ